LIFVRSAQLCGSAHARAIAVGDGAQERTGGVRVGSDALDRDEDRKVQAAGQVAWPAGSAQAAEAEPPDDIAASDPADRKSELGMLGRWGEGLRGGIPVDRP
jgi:hypothetical protein